MRTMLPALLVCFILYSCSGSNSHRETSAPNPMLGTWKLLKGTLVENGHATVTDYTSKTSFIKIINADHFAFIQHDLRKGKDSSASFTAGAGSYSLKDSIYTEHLEYCSAREWENNDFTFVVSMKSDTLVQKGVEKVPGTNVNRENTEVYVRLKK